MNHSAPLIPLISLIITQSILMDLARFRFPFKKIVIVISIQFAIQVILNGALLLVMGLDYYAKLYVLTIHVPVLITLYYTSKRRDFRDLFTFITSIFIGSCIAIPALWLSRLHNYRAWWYHVPRIFIFIVVFFLLHKFVRRYYMQIQDEIEKGWVVFCILPLIGVAAINLEFLRFSKNGNFMEVLVVSSIAIIIMVAVFGVFFYIFTQLHENYIIREQKRILSVQNKAQLDQFVQQKEASEKANRRWHDLRHNTEELIGLLETGDTETAITYLKEQRGMVEVPKAKYCLHPAVNSILCLWAERSRKAGISVGIQTDVQEKLDIEPMELAALFANAFENAYEGCLCLPDSIKKFIKVEARYNGKRLAIGFTNTCRDDIRFEGDMPISLKEGGGIGTHSITYTVKRFHGVAFFEEKNGVFSSRFVLNV